MSLDGGISEWNTTNRTGTKIPENKSGWVKAGYLSLTKSKKAIKIKINDTYYVVPISQLRQVLQEEKDFCNVSKAEK